MPNLYVASFYIVWKHSFRDHTEKSIFQLRLSVGKGLTSLILVVYNIY